MDTRYEQQGIKRIFSSENKFKLFLDVELAILEAQEIEMSNIFPLGTAKFIRENVKINVNRIEEIEKTTHHDVIAFCSHITEQLPSNISRLFHFGITSSDIVDTALSMQIREAIDLILFNTGILLLTLKHKAEEYKDVICLGRTHGMDAEPTSFGLKFLSTYAEINRYALELKDCSDQLTGKVSGAVGNYTFLNVSVESRALNKLGLLPEPVSTQIIPRDRYAKIVQIHALIASAIERMATEIRLLSQSGIEEVAEGFVSGQKGSSIMPHKRNPIACENLCGMSRIMRSHVIIALENISLWHERDISHSCTERMYLYDNISIMLYMVKKLNSVLKDIVVNLSTIDKHVKQNFECLSSSILHYIIANTKDTPREEVYKKIQEIIFTSQSYTEFLDKTKELCKYYFGNDDMCLINYPKFLNSVDDVYRRVLEK